MSIKTNKKLKTDANESMHKTSGNNVRVGEALARCACLRAAKRAAGNFLVVLQHATAFAAYPLIILLVSFSLSKCISFESFALFTDLVVASTITVIVSVCVALAVL